MNNKRPRILAVGANPAWQKVLQFDNLQHNAVNRASALWSFASGKGVNFARAGHCWNVADVQLLQFVGGDNGKLLLDDLKQEDLTVKSIVSNSPSRCCITCLSSADNSMTELIEPSPAPEVRFQEEAMEFFLETLPQVDAVALCGQLPADMDIDFYCRCAAAAAENGKLLLIDSWKKLESVLPQSRKAVLKINADELAALTNITDVRQALQSLLASSTLECIAITNGAERSYLALRSGQMFSFSVPVLPRVVNPVGSGDTASAVLLSELALQTAPEQAFARALAAASANCLSMKCGEFDRQQAEELCDNIEINEF